MKYTLCCVWLGLIGLFLVGCTDSSAVLRVRFEDELAKETVNKLELWVFRTNEVSCNALQNNQVDPLQPGLSRMAHLSMAYPPDQSGPQLPKIPTGLMTFFMEGRTELDQLVLEGCTEVEITSMGTVVVEIELGWVCHPTQEICFNDQDDDCDGLVDEGCNDCNSDLDCDDQNPCTYDFCISNKCHQGFLPNLTPCSDEDLCTLGDVCVSGACLGAERDCTAFDGPCKTGVCDPSVGECAPVARENGTACDDNAWCTQFDACLDGVCKGQDRDCDDEDPCTQDSCDEGDQVCKNTRIPIQDAEGPPGDETCSNRLDDDCDGYTDEHDANCIDCTTDIDCDDGNPCTEDTCQGLICSNIELADGTSCNDKKFCTVADKCIAGVCKGSTRDCSEGLGPCEVGICKEEQANCTKQAKANGEACDDGLWCSIGDQCISGVCSGGERDCEDGDGCTTDSCDETNNRCVHELTPVEEEEGPPGHESCTNSLDDDCDGNTDLADPNCVACTSDLECDDDNPCTADSCQAANCLNQPLTDNTPCDDHVWCTETDVCIQGQCTGTPKSCSHLDDECHDGRCDEKLSQCVADPRGDGTACDDGRWCTQPDQCQGGICQGPPRDCDDSDPCTNDRCVETVKQCEHKLELQENAEGPPGHSSCLNDQDDDCDGLTDLEDEDCYDCLSNQQCNDNNPCTKDTCTQGLCVTQPLSDGTSCDDGVWCTINDACVDSTCTGQPRDCSYLAQACKVAQCNEHTEVCEAISMPDDTSCSDGAFCSINDRCLAGECVGSPRDCSHLAAVCIDGVCDDDQDSCVAVDKAPNTPCQDGLFCTANDVCQQGKCVGVALDCDDSDSCTLDECDETNNRCTHVLNPQPGLEGGPGDATCFNGLDDDCDQATDLNDTDCYNCTSPQECADGNPCTQDICSSGLCSNPPVANGSSCDDSQFCTVNDHCTNGLCAGEPRDCSAFSQACQDGVCNESLGQCEAQPKADGTACSDEKWCTVGDQCQAGACVSTLRDCSDDNPCTLNECDEANDVCDNSATQEPLELDICGDALDQDCDGILDSCCLTNGDFNLISSLPSGVNPWFLESEDLNDDGIADFVAINRDGDSVSVLLGNGSNGHADGTFKASVEYAVGDSPYHLTLADFNDDHISDMAVANRSSHSVSIYFGQGDNGHPNGTFSNRLDLSVGESTGPVQVLSLDVNSDGITDLVTANWEGDSVAVLLGQGTNGLADGSFGTATLYPLGLTNVNPRAICAGDFDSDRIVDLAVANWNGGKIGLLKGGGSGGIADGSFAPMGSYDAGTSQVSILTDDFSSDGILDLAVVSMNTNAVNILLGNGSNGRGDGTFAERTAFSTGSTPVAASYADLDADGILDIVVAEWGANSVSVLLGNGSNGRADGSFGSRSSYDVDATFPSSVTVGDHTGDGLMDILSSNYGPDTISLLAASGSGGIGDGSFVKAGSIALGDGPRSMVTTDVNADGLIDLLVAHEDDNNIVSYLGLGSDGRPNGAFGMGSTISTCEKPIFVLNADINSDKIEDALVSCEESGVTTFLGAGSNAQGTGDFFALQPIETGSDPSMMAVRDLNADRILDLILIETDSLVVRIGQASNDVPLGLFSNAASFSVGSSPAAFDLGDINADNVLDLVVANRNTQVVSVKLGEGSQGKGTGSFVSASSMYSMGESPVHVILADLDNDGILDLVSANSESDNIAYRFGQGSGGRGDGSFGSLNSIAVGQKPVWVLAEDLDADNDLDLVVVNQDSASVSIILATSPGVFAPASEIAIGGRPRMVKAAHTDWDGRLDLLVLDQQGKQVVILRQAGICSQP